MNGQHDVEDVEAEDELSWWQALWYRLTEVPARVDAVEFWGRVLTWLALASWAGYFIQHGVDWEVIGRSFLHNINLAFHEFGHVFFRPFGRFMTILGGSLFQVTMPLALMGAFTFYRADNFGASVMLWWSGQNFVDVAPYIRDAQYRTLPLVGGGGESSHDWGNILVMLHRVDQCVAIANTSFRIGCLLMIVALVWGAWLLREQRAVLNGSGWPE